MPAEFEAYSPELIPGLVIAALVMAWGFGGRRSERGWQVLGTVVAGLGAIVAGLFLAAQIAQSPSFAWCGGRLAPAISLLKGYSLYYPTDQGPILVQMYGPMSALVYLPAGLASRPTGAMLIGTFIGMGIFIGPSMWFLLASRRGEGWVFVVLGAVGIFLLGSRHFVLAETLTRVTIDAPAIGFAACAFAMMVGNGVKPEWWRAMGCGVLAACSVWTKLTFLPITLAILGYAWLVWPTGAVLRFSLRFLISFAGVTCLLLLWLGMPLLFQNIVVPMNQPWRWANLPAVQAYVQAMAGLLGLVSPIQWIVLAAVLIRGRFPRLDRASMREWGRQNPWVLPLLGAILVLPTATLAFVKIGGIWNNAAGSSSLALLAGMSALIAGAQSPGNRLSRAVMLSLVVACCWIGPATWTRLVEGVRAWSDVSHNDHEEAYEFARAHPNQVWFAAYPLATLMAEDKLYHFTAGLESAAWGKYPPNDAHLRAGLPSDLRYIAYREGFEHEIMKRFPEFDRAVIVPEMPRWRVMTRGSTASPVSD